MAFVSSQKGKRAARDGLVFLALISVATGDKGEK